MNCHECRQWIDDLLLRDPDDAPPDEIAEHLAGCDECAREHELALQTLEAITPRALLAASPRLKGRIIAAIPTDRYAASTPFVVRRHRRAVRSALAFALAAAVLLAMILFPIDGGFSPSSKGDAFSLLSRSSAAEARLFAAGDIVHLVGEIVAEPVADPVLADGRWLPLISVGADGKTHFDQLKFGGEPRKGYAVRDESWYDPATHRFARVLSLEGRPMFANAYDGRSIHRLELDDQGHPRIKDEPVAPGFQPPKDASEFLGLLAFARNPQDRPERPDMVREEGAIRLADGTPAHVLRATFADADAVTGVEAYSRLTIRDDNHLVESLEYFLSGKKLYTIRRGTAGGHPEPQYGWDLAGLRPAVEKDRAGPKSPVRTLADMVRLDVPADDMAKRADYPVYLFSRDPGWTTRRQIVDMLDVVSPPHRMFAAVYPAKDRRHIVLFQAHCINAEMKAKPREGRLLYTSPAGIKVWSGKNDKAMAKIFLSSMGSTKLIFSDKPAEDCTGYMLETSEGTFPAIAVNGVLTDAELHGLADSLVRARPN